MWFGAMFQTEIGYCYCYCYCYLIRTTANFRLNLFPFLSPENKGSPLNRLLLPPLPLSWTRPPRSLTPFLIVLISPFVALSTATLSTVFL